MQDEIDRVVAHTDPRVNECIQRRAGERVLWLAEHPERIPERLAELDREWDVERCLELASASVSLFGLLQVARGRGGWLTVPLVVQGFFLQHAIQGWCPPLPALRRMGVRTQREIDEERYALIDVLRSVLAEDGEGVFRDAQVGIRSGARVGAT